MRLFMISSETQTKALFILVMISSGIMVLDSNIVRIYGNLPSEPSMFITSILFDCIFAFFVLSNYLLIRYLRQESLTTKIASGIYSKYALDAITLIQLTLCGLVGAITLELQVFGSYHLELLAITLYLSFLSGTGFLIFIAYQFFRWFAVRRQYTILLYALAFSLLVMDVIISVAYVADRLTYIDPVLKLKAIRSAIFTSQSPSITMNVLSTIYDYSSIIAFFLLWVSNVAQLRGYSVHLGELKYWILVIAPIFFYVFPLAVDETDILDSLRLEYGGQFNLLYTIVFSPYKQVGGLLFGITFWITSLKITRKTLRRTLQMAGAGMILLFGSAILHGLSYVVAPPFGLVTMSYLGLASYMLSTGIYLSSRELARDTVVRRELYRIMGEQYGLLRSTSSAEIERKLKNSVQPILAKIRAEEHDSIQTTNEDDAKEIIEQFFKELQSIKKGQQD
jgi:hypothetical protein